LLATEVPPFLLCSVSLLRCLACSNKQRTRSMISHQPAAVSACCCCFLLPLLFNSYPSAYMHFLSRLPPLPSFYLLCRTRPCQHLQHHQQRRRHGCLGTTPLPPGPGAEWALCCATCNAPRIRCPLGLRAAWPAEGDTHNTRRGLLAGFLAGWAPMPASWRDLAAGKKPQ
jgi:hypothetical protein